MNRWRADKKPAQNTKPRKRGHVPKAEFWDKRRPAWLSGREAERPKTPPARLLLLGGRAAAGKW